MIVGFLTGRYNYEASETNTSTIELSSFILSPTNMKRACILVALALSLHTAASASTDWEIENPVSIQARAVSLTRAVAGQVSLDAGQYRRLKQLSIRMLAATDDVKARFATAPDMRDEHLAAIQAEFQRELLELLRPAQRVAYQKLQSRRTALNK